MPKNEIYIQVDNYQKYSLKQKEILKLEKKYFDILFNIFSAQQFSDELKALMKNINQNYNTIHGIFKKDNVVDLAVERHINYRVHNHKLLKGKILSIYPSVISSDTAFVTDDAVINIDSKTTSVGGSPTDWRRQLVGCNQHSFDNKKNFWAGDKGIYMKIDGYLAKENIHKKPVLSYILSTLYHHDRDLKKESWYEDDKHKIKPYHGKEKKDKTEIQELFTNNIRLSCIPNGKLSSLFNHSIFTGVKSYYPAESPLPTNTKSMRIPLMSLATRYDEAGKDWEGLKSWKI